MAAVLLFCTAVPWVAGIDVAAADRNAVAGPLILFNENGAWSWFQDERAIVDAASGQIIVSSVADASGTGGVSRNGDVDVVSYNLATKTTQRFVLHAGLQDDDHDSAALILRPDGKYVASYSKHGSDGLVRWRVSTRPHDAASWEPEQTLDLATSGVTRNTTYSNLHYVPSEGGPRGRLYNFTRNQNFDPTILLSEDLGETFAYAGKLLTEGESSDRPYPRYVSDGRKIHFITTERHPRDFPNSIYHGYIENGRLFNASGRLRDSNLFDAAAVAPAALTRVFQNGTVFGGTTMNRAWTTDIAIDNKGHPCAVFTARADDSDHDHRFFYARFDGTHWRVHELARAGGFLYAPENDYTGLAALDPSDADTVYVSSSVDPRDDTSLAHFEIFRGLTVDAGVTWTWEPITYRSTADNLRPIVPAWDDQHTALLWLRGTYTTYRDYDLDVVGLIEFGPLVTTQNLNGDRSD